ncbi:MAG: UDP-N-acetylglucosamine 2-epimerase, partial [Bacteroidota bacterium]
MRTLISVIGARPQFIKAAPIELAMAAYPDIRFLSVHTGQHYDDNMSRIFFDQLGLRQPVANLQAGSGSHASQTAQMLPGLEALFLEHKPDMVLVYGDTNSTLAASLTAAKLCIPVA